MIKVTKHTRAGRLGKVVVCPCGFKVTVYHFAWGATKCQGCGKMVEKLDFFYEEKKVADSKERMPQRHHSVD